MSAFEETLNRVLDPQGIYWSGIDEDSVDPAKLQIVEIRIDIPSKEVSAAIANMKRDGWTLTEQPDEAEDSPQRLFFRRRQNLLPEAKVSMLTSALRVVFPIESARLWTWMVIAPEGDM